MPTWNDNVSTNSELPSMPSLVARDDDSCTEKSNETVTIFSSRFFPQHILDSNDEQIHEDDDISILTCIQQDFDLEAIHATEEPYQSSNHCLTTITELCANIKHSKACIPESTVNHTQQEEDIFHNCISEVPTQNEIFHNCTEDIFYDCE